MLVLITGASSGIGKSIAIEFAKNGYDLLLVARRKNLLEDLKIEIESKYKVSCDYYDCDLANNSDDLYKYTSSNNIKVDVLINNAGFGDFNNFINSDIDKLSNMIDLNNKALMKLSYYYSKEMIKYGGHIINVGSIASFVPGPYMAVYYATKAFVLSFSLALRQELKNSNVKVSVLCPGPTSSPFWKVAGASTSDSYDKLFARETDLCAKTCYRMYKRNKAYTIDGPIYKILIHVARLLNPVLSSKIFGLVQSKTKEVS